MLKKTVFRSFLAAAIFGTSLLSAPVVGMQSAFARDYNYGDNVYYNPGNARFFTNIKRNFGRVWWELPACYDNRVLSLIEDRTHWADTWTWHDGIEVSEISRAHEHQEISGPPNDGTERLIDRRYCGADVMMTDGKKHYVWYLIEKGQGLAGFGWNVTFCISARDPWKVNDGACRVLRR